MNVIEKLYGDNGMFNKLKTIKSNKQGTKHSSDMS
jgi:hypothetical protein